MIDRLQPSTRYEDLLDGIRGLMKAIKNKDQVFDQIDENDALINDCDDGERLIALEKRDKELVELLRKYGEKERACCMKIHEFFLNDIEDRISLKVDFT